MARRRNSHEQQEARDTSKIVRDRPLARSQFLERSPLELDEAEKLRERFEREWGAFRASGLLEGSSQAAGDESGAVVRRGRVAALSLVALVCGSCSQVCVEFLVRHDGRTGHIISSFEYTYCALLSSAAVLRPRTLPWSCHAQLWLAGVAYSALTNIGLAVRARGRAFKE